MKSPRRGRLAAPGPCCLTPIGTPGSQTDQLNLRGFCQGSGWPSAALHRPMSWPFPTPPGGGISKAWPHLSCVFCFLLEGQKCSHQDPIESSDSYGDLSDASDLKTPEKQSTNGSFSCDMAVPKNKMESDGEKKYPCPECGSFFRSKSYLNKHIQKVHVRALGGPLGDLGPALGSPFSPQQNMSLLESFGFQIVQSAFASSLVDPEVDQQPMGPEGK